MDYGPPREWLKWKYRRPRGVQRRGAPIGNGDSGKHKRRKVTAKEKALLPPPRLVMLVVDGGTGKHHWLRGQEAPQS